MADFRAELAALVAAYDEHGGKWPQHHEEALWQAVERARAALAQPEPAGAAATAAVAAAIAAGQPVTLPSGTVIADPAWFESRIAIRDVLAQPEPAPAAGGEAEELAKWLYHLADERTCHRRRGIRPHPSSLTRAAVLLERQALRPIPVAERLPGPDDCAGPWDCWWYSSFAWIIGDVEYGKRHRFRYWLPAHTLPLPEFDHE